MRNVPSHGVEAAGSEAPLCARLFIAVHLGYKYFSVLPFSVAPRPPGSPVGPNSVADAA